MFNIDEEKVETVDSDTGTTGGAQTEGGATVGEDHGDKVAGETQAQDSAAQ